MGLKCWRNEIIVPPQNLSFMYNLYSYKLCGLGIKSTIPFPELISKETFSDVIIRFENDEIFPNGRYDEKHHSANQSDIPILWEKKLIFRVIGGKEIIVNPNISIGNVLLRTLILCQGMAVILHQRGNLLLHASSVNMNGYAVAFMGQCGHGKSTTTFALTKKGYPLVTDDVLAINLECNPIPLVYPSFSRIKLNDDIIEYIKDSKNSFTKIHPDFQKYSYPVENNFSQDPLPLKRIYVLEKGETIEIQTLKSQDKLIELIKNTYTQGILNSSEKANNLSQCSNLIKKVPIKHLTICHSLEKLEELVNVVEKDAIIFQKNIL